MDIAKTTILGNSGLGVFALSTEKYTVVPFGVKEQTKSILVETLRTKIIQTTISNSVLVGTMAVGNSKTVFVPSNIGEKEYNILKDSLEGEVEVIELNSKLTALGNLMVINDKGAIISDMFEKSAQKQIRDVLNCEVTAGNLLGSPLVGSIIMSTNRGALVHPLLSEEEISEISSIF